MPNKSIDIAVNIAKERKTMKKRIVPNYEREEEIELVIGTGSKLNKSRMNRNFQVLFI